MDLGLPIPYLLEKILHAAGLIIGSLVVGLLIKYLIFKALSIYSRRSEAIIVNSIIKFVKRPAGYFLPVLVFSIIMPLMPFTGGSYEVMRRIIETSLIIAFAWVLTRVVYVFEEVVRQSYQISKADNIRERKLLTQLQFIKRLVVLAIAFVALSLVLMSFAAVRKIGTGLLTSAGIAGIIVGFAAQRSLANLLAGFQIAFTQPIRIDDVVLLEGEYGNIEEITLTYVVVRIWDQRRLILPINYFIEKPFQNWTRSNAELLGTIFIYTDYTIPVDLVRAELERLMQASPLWDKRVCKLHVTESKEKTLELRALVSAHDSSSAFELRCDIREKLIGFIQKNYPASLPKTRTDSPIGLNGFSSSTTEA
ncbi:mechanosensitive ion channel protein MscS [Adhaeribacter arboris]|uniref:Mechanosensitive ion channel protein MscS n=1 Tax=Adhaeribacter arboris TaxID=2072846 RepID=A0A2T2YG56_9BACT|nr:mechanosensitive ion channel domain-containing protein [Adhaeribacter arboris]PSR54497.1 mechanosensitive ion channel protein MscS [Adhaeribacter arboris]